MLQPGNTETKQAPAILFSYKNLIEGLTKGQTLYQLPAEIGI